MEINSWATQSGFHQRSCVGISCQDSHVCKSKSCYHVHKPQTHWTSFFVQILEELSENLRHCTDWVSILSHTAVYHRGQCTGISDASQALKTTAILHCYNGDSGQWSPAFRFPFSHMTSWYMNELIEFQDNTYSESEIIHRCLSYWYHMYYMCVMVQCEKSFSSIILLSNIIALLSFWKCIKNYDNRNSNSYSPFSWHICLFWHI